MADLGTKWRPVLEADAKDVDAKLKAQFAKSFPEAALRDIKWYPAVPPGIEDIEGKVLDRVKAAS